MSLENIEHFEFYAKMFPIIRDPDWEQCDHMSYGNVWFYRQTPMDHPRRSYSVGIVVRVGDWNYCWRGFLGGSTKGDKLNIAKDAPFGEVYAAAKAEAEKYFAQWDAEFEAELAQAKKRASEG
jgi:hypothetical protein